MKRGLVPVSTGSLVLVMLCTPSILTAEPPSLNTAPSDTSPHEYVNLPNLGDVWSPEYLRDHYASVVGPEILVDLGAGDGMEASCSRNLIVNHGWRGLLVEPARDAASRLAETYAEYPGVRTLQAEIFPGDIEIHLERASVPRDLDLLIVQLHANDDHERLRGVRGHPHEPGG